MAFNLPFLEGGCVWKCQGTYRAHGSYWSDTIFLGPWNVSGHMPPNSLLQPVHVPLLQGF